MELGRKRREEATTLLKEEEARFMSAGVEEKEGRKGEE